MGKMIDLTGQKFGRLTATLLTKRTNRKEAYWVCLCECGNTTTVSGYHLRSGHTQSCGCLHSEVTAKMLRVHGMTGTPTYVSWAGMIQRCFDQNSTSYPRYGARGITVCERWLAFENFYADMGERPEGYSLDRIDPNGNYQPGNVRWATDEHQNNNKRNSKIISVNGEPMTIGEAARKYNIHYHSLHSRLRMGWSPEEAVSIPIQKDRDIRYIHPRV